MLYKFGRLTLDTDSVILSYDRVPVALPCKAVLTLALLVERSGAVVSKAEFMDRLWPDGFVEESNLTQYIYLLRKALTAHGIVDPIQTVPRRGYRFALGVSSAAATVEGKGRPSYGWSALAAAIVLLLFAVSGSAGPAGRGLTLSAHDHQLYQLGRYYWSLRTVDGLRKSLTYFRAVAADARDSPLPRSGLADAYIGLYDYACTGIACMRYERLAKLEARRAVALDAQSAEAHTSLAMTLNAFDHDYAASDAEFKRAMRLDGGYSLAYEWYGNSLLIRGRLDDARRMLERAVALQPVAPATFGWLARTAYYEHQYRSSIVYAREALNLAPSRAETRVVLGLAYEKLGERRNAIAAFAPLHGATALIAGVEANTGHNGRARSLIARSRDPVNVAFDFIALHDYRQALRYLGQVRMVNAMERAFLALDPRLDPVRNDIRFARWTS